MTCFNAKRRAFLQLTGAAICMCGGLKGMALADETAPLLDYCAVTYPTDEEKADALAVVEKENQGLSLDSSEAAALRVHPTWGRWNPDRVSKNKPLRVGFMQKDHPVNHVVRAAGREWQKHMQLRFDFEAKDKFDILVTQDAAGNSSELGVASKFKARKGLPSLRLQRFTTHSERQKFGIALHELGHALGLIHEHASPNANLDFDEKAVLDYYRDKNGWNESLTRRNVLNPYRKSKLGAITDFDPDSIMIYELPGILFTDGRTEFSTNYGLSDLDKLLIGRIYGEPEGN